MKRKSKSSPTPAIWRAKESLNSRRSSRRKKKRSGQHTRGLKEHQATKPDQNKHIPRFSLFESTLSFPYVNFTHTIHTRARHKTFIRSSVQFNQSNPVQSDLVQFNPIQFSSVPLQQGAGITHTLFSTSTILGTTYIRIFQAPYHFMFCWTPLRRHVIAFFSLSLKPFFFPSRFNES
jgi:hypothetical protein